MHKQALPEMELIVAAGRASADERIPDIMREGVDWGEVRRRALQHGMMPLVYKNVVSRFADEIETEFAAEWREAYLESARRNIYLAGHLLSLLTSLEGIGVQAVPFKGPTLAQLLHDDISLRGFSDLDLLIKHADVIETTKWLVSNGYEPQFPLAEKQIERLARIRNEHAFWNDEFGVTIDLHWSLNPRYLSSATSTQAIWARMATLDMFGRPVPTLADEDLLLFLCVHGGKHCWERIGWLCDVAALLHKRPAIRLCDVLNQSREDGTELFLLLGLHAAHEHFGIALPPEMVEAIRTKPELNELAEDIRNRLLVEPNRRISGAAERRFNRKLTTGVARKVQFAVDNIFAPTPIEWLRFPLPGGLSFLYYVIRPIRLVLKRLSGVSRGGHDLHEVHTQRLFSARPKPYLKGE